MLGSQVNSSIPLLIFSSLVVPEPSYSSLSDHPSTILYIIPPAIRVLFTDLSFQMSKLNITIHTTSSLF